MYKYLHKGDSGGGGGGGGGGGDDDDDDDDDDDNDNDNNNNNNNNLKSKSTVNTFWTHCVCQCFQLRVPQNHKVPWFCKKSWNKYINILKNCEKFQISLEISMTSCFTVGKTGVI
jgi:hypothetical protein